MSKIFVIGMHKTGLTSMWDALNILGYTAAHGGNPNACLLFPYWPSNMLISNYSDKEEKLNPFWDYVVSSGYYKYDAFMDYPVMWIYKYLDKQEPESKFIYTQRNVADVVTSTTNHASQIIGLSTPVSKDISDRYLNHQTAVLDYFEGKDNLLIMDIVDNGDGWEKLCGFLKIDKIPELPFPHSNVGLYRKNE